MKFYKIKKPVNQGFTGFSVPIIGLSAEKEASELWVYMSDIQTLKNSKIVLLTESLT